MKYDVHSIPSVQIAMLLRCDAVYFGTYYSHTEDGCNFCMQQKLGFVCTLYPVVCRLHCLLLL